MQSKVTSYPDLIREWERLLNAAKENAANLPSAEIYRTTMQKIFDQVKDAKLRQDSLQAERQAVTQEFDKLVLAGKDAAMRLRGAARIDLGPRSEQLVHFGVAPLRKRAARAAKTPVLTEPTVTSPKA